MTEAEPDWTALRLYPAAASAASDAPPAAVAPVEAPAAAEPETWSPSEPEPRADEAATASRKSLSTTTP